MTQLDKVMIMSAATAAFAVVLLAAPGYAQNAPAANGEASVSLPARDNAIRPFRIDVPEEALVDLRRRLVATRWPERETVSDQSQGVRLAKFQELVRYWGTDYDWRKAEAKLNALPQFVTEIDGLDIQWTRGGRLRSRTPVDARLWLLG